VDVYVIGHLNLYYASRFKKFRIPFNLYTLFTLYILTALFQSTLFIAPPLESYDWSSFKMNLGAVTNVQLVNASLAVQLANAWMCQHKNG
jgi:hypothetical protein